MHIKVFIAEMLGTFIILLVFFATSLLVPETKAAPWLPSMAIGIATIAVTYGLGQISGGHFNPAITTGLVAAKRFDMAHAPFFWIAQLAGALLAAGAIFLIITATPPNAGTENTSFSLLANRAGGQDLSALIVAFMSEMILTAIVMIVFIGVTSHNSLLPFAPIAIGLGVAMCYLIVMPLTNAGLNPARSTAAALFAGIENIGQLWIFWIAPVAGSCIGGLTARYLYSDT